MTAPSPASTPSPAPSARAFSRVGPRQGVISLGLEVFVAPLASQAVRVVHTAWRPRGPAVSPSAPDADLDPQP